MLLAQKEDYCWYFGYDPTVGGQWNATELNFNETPAKTSIANGIKVWLRATNASVCDTAGNLLFYTNGIAVFDKSHEIMENGDTLNPGYHYSEHHDYGYVVLQGAIILKDPGDPMQYYLFHLGAGTHPNYGGGQSPFYYTKIDMRDNGGLGAVVEKNHVLRRGFMGVVTACRHANGRDWWVMIPDYGAISNSFFTWLLSPAGVEGPFVQEIGDRAMYKNMQDGGVNIAFSPDGSKFARMDIEFGVQLFDFDRCTGLLSNYRKQRFPARISPGSGAAFSPNGRFLYYTSTLQIMQWDTDMGELPEAVDTVAVYDGFGEWNSASTFFLLQNGPDGKIYGNCTSTVPRLHVIHEPDKKGIACNVEQHGIQLYGRNAFSLPHFPNYRLGKLEGSACDTLSSVHTPGQRPEEIARVYPNPAKDRLTITYSIHNSGSYCFEIRDAAGKLHFEKAWDVPLQEQSFSLGALPAGIYIYTLRLENGRTQSGKLVIE